MFLETTKEILKKYDIDRYNGFLPREDPLEKLPTAYKAWDELNENLVEALASREFVKAVHELPLLPIGEMQKSELERAMLLLSGFAHSYVYCTKAEKRHLPPQIAVPWVEVANRLGRLPIISHSALVLNNWRRIDKEQPIQLDNLDTLLKMQGSKDEAWFFLVTTNIEKTGAPAISLLLEGVLHYKNGNLEQAIAYLEQAIPILEALPKAMKEMYKHCEPMLFYQEIRPFFDSFENIRYEGVEPEIRNYKGASAAQSSLIQFLDAVFGIDYKNRPSTQDYLLEMQKYMPSAHRAFLELVTSYYNFRGAKGESTVFDALYDRAVEQLIAFRNEHLRMVGMYVIQPARTLNASSKGTGGTNPLKFLKSIRDLNKAQVSSFKSQNTNVKTEFK